ncbi:protein bassoon-like, partial [Scleropages formosus]
LDEKTGARPGPGDGRTGPPGRGQELPAGSPGHSQNQAQGPSSRQELQVDVKAGKSPSATPVHGSAPTSPYSLPQIAPMPSSTLCPVCKTTDLSASQDRSSCNTCTQCRSTVCNQCGFNPNPHLTEVQEWLCLNCQMQRALGMDMTTPRAKGQQETELSPGTEMHVRPTLQPSKSDTQTQERQERGGRSSQPLVKAPSQPDLSRSSTTHQPEQARSAGSSPSRQSQEQPFGKLFGFGASLLNQASTLISAEALAPSQPQPSSAKGPHVPASGSAPGLHAPPKKQPAPMPKGPEKTKANCPLCKTELNIQSTSEPPNYNSCTQCHAQVCNMCGFNPMPHLVEKKEWLCLNCQTQRLMCGALEEPLPVLPPSAVLQKTGSPQHQTPASQEQPLQKKGQGQHADSRLTGQQLQQKPPEFQLFCKVSSETEREAAGQGKAQKHAQNGEGDLIKTVSKQETKSSTQSLSDTGYSSDGISSSHSEITGLVQEEEMKLTKGEVHEHSLPTHSEVPKLESSKESLLQSKSDPRQELSREHRPSDGDDKKTRPRSLSISQDGCGLDEELGDIREEDNSLPDWERRHNHRKPPKDLTDEDIMRRHILEMSADEEENNEDKEYSYQKLKKSPKHGGDLGKEKRRLSHHSNSYEEERKGATRAFKGTAEDEDDDLLTSQGGLRRFKTIELNTANSYNRDMELSNDNDLSLDREPELEMESLTGSPDERSRGEYSSTLPATTPSYTSGTSPTSVSSMEEDSDSSPSRRQKLEEAKQQRKARHRSHGPLLPTIEDSSEEDELREEEELLREQEKMREVEQQKIRTEQVYEEMVRKAETLQKQQTQQKNLRSGHQQQFSTYDMQQITTNRFETVGKQLLEAGSSSTKLLEQNNPPLTPGTSPTQVSAPVSFSSGGETGARGAHSMNPAVASQGNQMLTTNQTSPHFHQRGSPAASSSISGKTAEVTQGYNQRDGTARKCIPANTQKTSSEPVSSSLTSKVFSYFKGTSPTASPSTSPTQSPSRSTSRASTADSSTRGTETGSKPVHRADHGATTPAQTPNRNAPPRLSRQQSSQESPFMVVTLGSEPVSPSKPVTVNSSTSPLSSPTRLRRQPTFETSTPTSPHPHLHQSPPQHSSYKTQTGERVITGTSTAGTCSRGSLPVENISLCRISTVPGTSRVVEQGKMQSSNVVDLRTPLKPTPVIMTEQGMDLTSVATETRKYSIGNEASSSRHITAVQPLIMNLNAQEHPHVSVSTPTTVSITVASSMFISQPKQPVVYGDPLQNRVDLAPRDIFCGVPLELKNKPTAMNLSTSKSHVMMVELEGGASQGAAVTQLVKAAEPPPQEVLDLTGQIKPEAQVACCDVVYKLPFTGTCKGPFAQKPKGTDNSSTTEPSQSRQFASDSQYSGTHVHESDQEDFQYQRHVESKISVREDHKPQSLPASGRLQPSMSDTNLSVVGIHHCITKSNPPDLAVDLSTMKEAYEGSYFGGVGVQYGSYTDLRQQSDIIGQTFPIRRYGSMSNINTDYRCSSRDPSSFQESNLAQYSATTAREISRMCADLNSMDQFGGRSGSNPEHLQYSTTDVYGLRGRLSLQQGLPSMRSNIMYSSDGRQTPHGQACANLFNARQASLRALYPSAVRAADGMIYSTINTPIASTLPITTQPASVLRPLQRGVYRPYPAGNMTTVPLASLTRLPLIAPRMPLSAQRPYRYPPPCRFPMASIPASASAAGTALETPVYLGKPSVTPTVPGTMHTVSPPYSHLPAHSAAIGSVCTTAVATSSSAGIPTSQQLQLQPHPEMGNVQKQHTQPQIQMQPQTIPQIPSQLLPQVEPIRQAHIQTQLQTHSEPQIQPHIQQQTELQAQAKIQPQAVPQGAVQAQVLPQTQTQPLQQTQPQTQCETVSQAAKPLTVSTSTSNPETAKEEERLRQQHEQLLQLERERVELEKLRQLRLQEELERDHMPPEFQRTLGPNVQFWQPYVDGQVVQGVIPSRSLPSSASERSLKNNDELLESKVIKKRNSMPRLRDGVEGNDSQPTVKRIADSSVQTDDEDGEERLIVSRRRRTRRIVDSSVQTDDEDQDEWEQPIRRRRSRFSKHSESSSESKADMSKVASQSVAIQTTNDSSCQTEPDQLGRVSPAIHISTAESKVEFLHYISAPERTLKGESLACQTEPEAQSQGVVMPQLNVPTTVSPYSSNTQLAGPGAADALSSRIPGMTKFERRKPDPLDISYQNHMHSESLSNLVRQPPKSPQVLYSPVSPLSPHRLLENSFSSSERLNKAHVTPQKHFTAESPQRHQSLPRPVKCVQRSMSDPKPLSPTSEDPSRTRFSLYHHQALQNSQLGTLQQSSPIRKVKRTLPSPPPEETPLPIMTPALPKIYSSPSTPQRVLPRPASDDPKTGLLNELKVVEQESSKLRMQQAELEEEEKEIDAKLRYLELGITQRKETMIKERERRELAYMRSIGDTRDYVSDSDLSNLHMVGTTFDGSGLLVKPSTAPMNQFTTDQMISTSPFLNYQYPQSQPAPVPQSTPVYQQIGFQPPQYPADSQSQPQPGTFQPQLAAPSTQQAQASGAFPTHSLPQPSSYQTDLRVQQSHPGFQHSPGPTSYASQTLPYPYAGQTPYHTGQSISFQPQADMLTAHQKPRQTSLADLEQKIPTNYEVISNPTVMVTTTGQDGTCNAGYSSTTMAGTCGQYKPPEQSLSDCIHSDVSPTSTYTSEGLYSNLEHNIPRNYVMIEDISELTKENMNTSSDMQRTNGNGRYGSESPSMRMASYGRVDEVTEDLYDPHGSVKARSSYHPQGKDSNSQMSSSSTVGIGSSYYCDDYKFSTRTGSGSGPPQKQSSKNMAPTVSSKRSKHRKPGTEQKISKFSPIEEARDVESDLASYSIPTSASNSSTVASRARKLQDDITYGLKKNVYDQQKYYGLSSREGLEEDDRVYSSGRSRSTGYGMDKVTSRDSNSCRSKSYERDIVERSQRGHRSRPSARAQNLEEESPLSPVGKPMGAGRGPVGPELHDSHNQYGSSHSLPDVQEHMKDSQRSHIYKPDDPYLVDDMHCAVSDSEAYHLGQEETDWFEKPREVRSDRSKHYGGSSHSSTHRRSHAKQTYHDYDEPPEEDNWSQDDYSHQRPSSTTSRDHRHHGTSSGRHSSSRHSADDPRPSRTSRGHHKDPSMRHDSRGSSSTQKRGTSESRSTQGYHSSDYSRDSSSHSHSSAGQRTQKQLPSSSSRRQDPQGPPSAAPRQQPSSQQQRLTGGATPERQQEGQPLAGAGEGAGSSTTQEQQTKPGQSQTPGLTQTQSPAQSQGPNQLQAGPQPATAVKTDLADDNSALGMKSAGSQPAKAPTSGIGSKAAPKPGGVGSTIAGQPAADGDSVFSKILPGGAAEQAGKLGDAVSALGKKFTSFWTETPDARKSCGSEPFASPCREERRGSGSVPASGSAVRHLIPST